MKFSSVLVLLLLFAINGGSLYAFHSLWSFPVCSRFQSNTVFNAHDNPDPRSLPFFSNDQSKSLESLIRFGEVWFSHSALRNENINCLESEFLTVFGCIAKVKLKVEVTNSNLLKVEGIADSKVALGILAFVAKLTEKMSPEEVLGTSSESIGRSSGIARVLPTGRLNGFANIWKTVQKRLKEYNSTIELKVDPKEKKDPRSEEIAVLLSGGVDSSLALALLASKGLKLRAYYLKIWLEDELSHLNQCPWEEDLLFAQAVCEQFNVPLETVPLQREYWDYVVNYTLREAREGRTPNPDIMCNSMVKFGAFLQYIGQYHHRIATGHYARLLPSPWTRPLLRDRLERMGFLELSNYSVFLGRSPDPVKDQSYFLSNLNQRQLQKCLFPIDSLQKTEVRQMAERLALATQARKDSQGICFLGKLKFEEFLKHYLGELPGKIVYKGPENSSDPLNALQNGQAIGSHRGLWFHTIGQRKGLGNLLFPHVLHHGTFYVLNKDLAENTLYVTNHWDWVDAPRKICLLHRVNWLIGAPSIANSTQLSDYRPEFTVLDPKKHFVRSEDYLVTVKLRHGPSLLPAKVSWILNKDSRDEIDLVRIELLERDKGIAPGQFAVIYLEDYCLASGVIVGTG